MNFWSTEEGKIMAHAMHDHNSGLGMVRNYQKCATIVIEKLDFPEKEQVLEYLNKAKERTKVCQEAMDFAYKEIKKLKERT